MLILIEKVTEMTEDSYKGLGEYINTDDIKYIRTWHTKHGLKEKYPEGFSLIKLYDGREFKCSQSLEQLNDRINGMKNINGKEEA